MLTSMANQATPTTPAASGGLEQRIGVGFVAGMYYDVVGFLLFRSNKREGGKALYPTTRVVHAISRAEIDAALQAADEVVVEGDEELLSYAATKATRETSFTKLTKIALLEIIFGVVGILCLAIGGIYYFLDHQTGSTLVYPPHPSDPPAITPDSVGAQNSFLEVLPSIVWPLVVLVAILAVFSIMRKSIDSGSNVEVSWKVTERFSGRLVITKVTTRTSKRNPVT